MELGSERHGERSWSLAARSADGPSWSTAVAARRPPRRLRLAAVALAAAAALLAGGVVAGHPVIAAGGAAARADPAADSRPAPDDGGADHGNPDRSPSAITGVDVPPLAGPPTQTWAGPSVVRRRDTPDRYVRQPSRPYRSFTLAATGDLLIHTPVRTRAATPDGGFDFGPQLAAAAPDVAAADVGLCHLEVPLDPDGPYSSYPIFNAPAPLADGIAATGWDICSTASNHSADRGFDGLVDTLAALESAGVEHRGMFRSETEWGTPRLLQVGRTALGIVSATYGLNGLPQPGGHPWAVQLIDVEVLLQKARDLRAAGADVVVLAMHWGEEYQHQPSAYQRDVATRLMAGDEVDAIIGHHAHVVQPVEWIAGKPVVYGLGNFLSGQRPAERRDGAVVTLAFVEDHTGWQVADVHAQPTWVDDAYAVVTADPDQGGVLGASAQRTLGHLGVRLSPPPPAPREPPTRYVRPS